MKKYFAMIALLLMCAGVQAESAKRILDKAAATVSNPGGVQAHFQMISKQFGTTNGEIAVKGKKFHATTPDATIWFDGKTQWTYMKGNDEVNISNPSGHNYKQSTHITSSTSIRRATNCRLKRWRTHMRSTLYPTRKNRKYRKCISSLTKLPIILHMLR